MGSLPRRSALHCVPFDFSLAPLFCHPPCACSSSPPESWQFRPDIMQSVWGSPAVGLDRGACSPSPWRWRQLAGSPCPGDQRCNVFHFISLLLLFMSSSMCVLLLPARKLAAPARHYTVRLGQPSGGLDRGACSPSPWRARQLAGI